MVALSTGIRLSPIGEVSTAAGTAGILGELWAVGGTTGVVILEPQVDAFDHTLSEGFPPVSGRDSGQAAK